MILTFYKLFNGNKKNWRPNCSKPFFFQYCLTKSTLKWGKKNYLLAPFFKFLSFKRVAANLCIIWSESIIYWQKSGKNTKSWPHLFKFECKQKILEVTHALPKYTVVLSLHILFIPSVLGIQVPVNLKVFVLHPSSTCHCLFSDAHISPNTSNDPFLLDFLI